MYPHVAFLMATGVGDIGLGIQAMKQGADDYLMKPLQFDAVLASVERALEMHRLERENEDYRKRLEQMVDVRTRELQAALVHISQTYDQTLEVLGAALDLKDGNTFAHTRRVTRYSLEIAKAMGCSEDEIHQLKRGAYLHDIGKIGIPEAVLLKPAKLTPVEMSVMRTHAYIGYEAVKCVSFLAGAAEIVLTHHERYDGSGYPQGLSRNEIPLGARVFAVADALDAMTSDRCYRRAIPGSAARAEIRRQSGRQFEPRVVDAFFSLPEHTWEEIRLAVVESPASPKAVGLEKLLPANRNSSTRRDPDPVRRARPVN
jgi:putative nucleotidyltransferase with HDIG domain